ncbi:hypothetical protein [Sphingomonas sp. BK235]|uniref:hypothetical protein n=1 Tax=Sphingomonas sp. BK235 TaxID=2512131 RepID=UPI0010E7DD39|nr:hypothetical protein [Sphingomonas sp. BK235]TCP34062.1 hypothetical protein EV292_10452 [Sphingomonas sp. BK235]
MFRDATPTRVRDELARARRTAAMVTDPISVGSLRRYIGELEGELHRRGAL